MKKKSILPFFEAWDLHSLASFEDLIIVLWDLTAYIHPSSWESPIPDSWGGCLSCRVQNTWYYIVYTLGPQQPMEKRNFYTPKYG